MTYLLVEPICKGYSHVPTNSGVLATMKLAFPETALHFWAEANHGRLVQDYLERKDASFSSVFEWSGSGSFHKAMLEKRPWLQRWRTLRSVFQRITTQKPQALIFTALDGIGLLLLKLLLHRFAPEQRVICIMHGVMSKLADGTHSVKTTLFRQSLVAANHRLRLSYLVLAPSIRWTIEQYLPPLSGYVDAIDHPHLFQPPPPSGDAWPVAPVNFGFVGGNSPVKGFSIFKQLAVDVTAQLENVGRPPARFTAIGHSNTAASDPIEQSLGLSTSFLSTEDYGRRIAAVDYLVFPFRPKDYSLRASATILDAFEHLKPVVALANPLLSNYFERMGNIGYLCLDYKELKRQVLALSKHVPHTQYRAQCQTILSGRHLFEPELLAPRLRSILLISPTEESRDRPALWTERKESG